MENLTPKQIVAELDKYIIGQGDAKRNVAIALRNRWRRMNVQGEIKNDIITMTNNGDGIDIVKHPVYNVWIPEMIFAQLRTSTNYNKDEEKTTGGKNGFGFKLVLIWSTYGKIETVDKTRRLKYIQEFENNLDIIHTPVITKTTCKPYTSCLLYTSDAADE